MNIKINVNFSDISGKPYTFTGLRELYEFLVQERDYWKNASARIKKDGMAEHQHIHVHASMTELINLIDSWGEDVESWDEGQMTTKMHDIQQRYLRHYPASWLWSGHPYSEAYISCHERYGNEAAEAFLDVVLRNNTNGIANANKFFGVMSAYEYLTQESPIIQRSESERASLEHLRAELDEAKTTLIGEVEDFKDDYSDWYAETQVGAEKLYRVNRKLGERQARKNDKAFNEQLRTWSGAVDELEKTYEEKLRLQKPAEYWNKAARKYGIQGGLWSLAIVAAVVVGLIYFREFFLTWLRGQEIGIQLNTVQGVVLFGTIAAVYAYLLRVLSRLAFSSFHLMRDAEEREQLTYLYLSLSMETEVDKDSREIVLQALFSRSETGLLTVESGPTMPGLHEVVRAASTVKR
ncbi:MAG: DUF6161 domain-containing protein [Pseudomonadota bacterium]